MTTVASVTSRGTKHRGIRVPDELWDPFAEKAEREGTNASEKLRAFMVADLAEDGIIVKGETT